MAEKTIEFEGVDIIVTEPDPDYQGGRQDDILIFIDTTDLREGRRLRIRINDARLFEGTPGEGDETVKYDRYEGLYIAQGE